MSTSCGLERKASKSSNCSFELFILVAPTRLFSLSPFLAHHCHSPPRCWFFNVHEQITLSTNSVSCSCRLSLHIAYRPVFLLVVSFHFVKRNPPCHAMQKNSMGERESSARNACLPYCELSKRMNQMVWCQQCLLTLHTLILTCKTIIMSSGANCSGPLVLSFPSSHTLYAAWCTCCTQCTLHTAHELPVNCLELNRVDSVKANPVFETYVKATGCGKEEEAKAGTRECSRTYTVHCTRRAQIHLRP